MTRVRKIGTYVLWNCLHNIWNKFLVAIFAPIFYIDFHKIRVYSIVSSSIKNGRKWGNMSKLKDIRKKCGFEPVFIAALLGVGYKQYNNLENGRNKLDKLKIEKLMEVFRLGKEEMTIIANETYKGGN